MWLIFFAFITNNNKYTLKFSLIHVSVTLYNNVSFVHISYIS